MAAHCLLLLALVALASAATETKLPNSFIDQADLATSLAPEQVRLAFGDSSTSIVVGWLTKSIPSASYVPTLEFAAQSGKSQVLSGFTRHYYSSYNHYVILDNLEPGTKYWYIPDGANQTFTFICPKGTLPATVAVLADYGVGSNSAATTNYLIKIREQLDFVLHVGDISYADDSDLGFDNPIAYERTWNDWSNGIQAVSSMMPYQVVPGNHEADCRNVGSFSCEPQLRNFSAYRSRFRMPSNGVENMWWSMNYAGVHWTGMNTETDYPGSPSQHDSAIGPPGGPFGSTVSQIDFLHADMSSPAATNALWRIAFGHRPLYTSEVADFPPSFSTKSLVDAFEPLLHQYKTDIYFCGHVHDYERYWPVYNSVVEQKSYANPTSTVHITQGAAGSAEGHSNVSEKHPSLAFSDNTSFGVGLLTIHNATAIQWQFVNAADGSVVDEIWLTR